MHKFFITISFFLFIVSCGQLHSTDEPVPIDEKQLQAFPLAFQGEYLNSDDNSILTITDNSITKTYDFDHVFLKDNIGRLAGTVKY